MQGTGGTAAGMEGTEEGTGGEGPEKQEDSKDEVPILEKMMAPVYALLHDH